MKKFLSCIWLLSVLACIACLILFRQLPGGELWKGYSVLYVPDNVPENSVLQALDEAQVKEYTCLSNQFLPTDLKADSCEVSLISINPDAMNYLLKRNNYFFDKSGKYRLYYVPVFYKNRLNQVCSILSDVSGKNCGVDSKASYPFLLPLFVLIYSVVLYLFARKKVLYGILCILPFFFTVSFPFLSSAIASLLLLTILFMVSNIFGRRDFLKILLKKYVFMVLALISVISCFSEGIASGFVFILVLASEYAVFHFFRQYQIIRYKKNQFTPVMIRSSFAVPQFSGKEKTVFGVLVLLVISSFVFSVLFSGNTSKENGKLSFPSVSVSQKSDSLPVLKDYYVWDYSVRSFPYKSLNENYSVIGETHIPRFEKNGNRVQSHTDVLEFSDNYAEGVYNKIDLLPFNAFEKIMKKQGEEFSAGYASNGSHHLSLFCIIFSFIQFSMILVYFAWILIKRK